MRKHKWLWLSLVTLLAAALTWFYLVHEGLPRYLRAPTSLLLTPVALADGLCYALGVRGIYGNIPAVFVVNWLTSLVGCALAGWLWRRFKQQRTANNQL